MASQETVADAIVVASDSEDLRIHSIEWQDIDPLPSHTDDGEPDEPPRRFPSLRSLTPSVVANDDASDRPALVEQPISSTTVEPHYLAYPRNGRSKRRKVVPNSSKPPVLKKVVFSTTMTTNIMLWFKDCKDHGLFNSSKRRDYGPAWESVLERCQKSWPQFAWSQKTIAAKYDTEKRRFQAFKMLLEGFSGVTYDHITGLPEASESTWEAFLSKNNTKHHGFSWLRRVPLGYREVYESVFWREQGIESVVMEPSKSQATADPEILDDGDSNKGHGCLLSNNDDEFMSTTPSISGSTPSRRLASAHGHCLEANPDQTPPRNYEPLITILKSGKRARHTESAVLGDLFREGATILATPRLPGAGDLELAIKDLQDMFVGELNDEEILNCVEYLQSNPIRATVWNGFTPDVKKTYVQRWKVGI
ncbi:hypothetical protein VTI28DRAFT_8681 [Corynascus sepedonium]